MHTICANQWKQNGYIVGNDEKEALIIDPGSHFELYLETIEDARLTPLAIMNTHAHFDHVGAVDRCRNHFGIDFYLHRGDHRLLRQANMYRLVFGGISSVPVPVVTNDFAETGEVFSVGHFEIQWIATPGHTPGGVCLCIGGDLFTGDTLMPSGAGRTDLPGGEPEKITESIEKLTALDGALTVWPGHGRPLKLTDALDNVRCVHASA